MRLFLIGGMIGIVRWLELLAYGIFAFEVTGSPVLVAIVALMRFAALAALSLVFGAAADQVSPRRILTWATAGVTAVTLGMVTLEAAGGLTYGWILAATLTSSVFWACEMPLRRKMIGDIAGEDRLARAMSFEYATSTGTRMVGPLLGGVIYQTIGMGGIFLVALALYVASLGLALGIAPIGSRRTGRFQPILALVGAARSARRAWGQNDVFCIMGITVIFNIWGFPFVSMVPVIGADSLGLSPAWIGYITAIEGVTGLIGVILVGMFARPWFYRRLYVAGLALHLTAVAFIGLVPGIWSLGLGLALAGIATACFAGMQATLVYVVAPPGMRGRYMGLISICIGAGLIGFANVGLLAEWIGAEAALAVMAAQGAVALTWLLWRWTAFQIEIGART